MTIADIKKTTETKMEQSIAAFKNNLTKIRTGRANPALLDTIHVDYYGSMVPLSQVANVSLMDSRTISVQPWEKGMGAKIEKAIRESELGLNPASMGDLIRVPMPPMSEERRKEMTKLARTEGENGKIAIRNLRRDANESVKKLVKDKEASEDDQKRAEADVQKLTDKRMTEIDQLVAAKEQHDTNSKELAIISKEVIGLMKQLNLTQEQVEQQIPKTPESGVSKPQRPHSKTPSRSGSAIRKRAAEDLEDKMEGDEDSKMHPSPETPTTAPAGGMNPAPIVAANLAGQEQGAQPAGTSHGGGQVHFAQRGQHTHWEWLSQLQQRKRNRQTNKRGERRQPPR